MSEQDTMHYVLLAHIPGRHDLTQAMLTAVWQCLKEDGICDALFYDGGVRCCEDFIAFMTAEDVYCYVVYAGGVPLALTWLNNFSGRAAMIHFAVLAAGLPHKTAIGRHVVRFLLTARPESKRDDSREGGSGEYCLDALYGLTPRPYAHALRFIRRLGFRLQGHIPGAVCLRQAGGPARYVDGVLSVCSRETVLP